jgi:class 3 adenylate cyclase
MRQAIAKLGKEATLADLLTFIKQTFGITLDRGLAYNYKSLVSSGTKAKPKGRKPGRKPKRASAAAASNGSKTVAIMVEDIRAVKALADRIGAEKVEQLAK